jgi:iron complex outermembrane receptor protein
MEIRLMDSVALQGGTMRFYSCRRSSLVVALLISSAGIFNVAHAADNSSDTTATSLETVIVTGTRRADRSVNDSDVPVDVLTAKDFSSIASVDLDDKLATEDPSFTVQSKPHYGSLVFIRPAELRGLDPDDTLVLVDGKRQHKSALVDTNILGGADQGTDLSQIPSNAIGRVEVLRDGASAQYGSDAVAGVINIILKDTTDTNGYVQWGRTYVGDGANIQTAATTGFNFDNDRGSVTGTAEYNHSDYTDRSIQTVQATALTAAGTPPAFGAPKDGHVDPWGDPLVSNYHFALNGHYDISSSIQIYAFALMGNNDGTEFGNWRSPTSSTLATSIFQKPPYNLYPTYSAVSRFPGGITPSQNNQAFDFSTAVGVKGSFTDDLTYDLSVNYGANRIHIYGINTYNASMGPLSPTSFNAGGASQSELDSNADFVYLWNVGLVTPINVAFGAEFRREVFSTVAGAPDSYEVGPFSDLPSGASAITVITPAAVGVWGRNSGGLYIDTDADLTHSLNVDAAARFEDYSDFGSALVGKLASRYQLFDGLALRGAISNGFRAPTPGQENYISQTINPNPALPGQVYTVTHLQASSPIAEGLGSQPLRAEKSVNFSGGFVAQPFDGFTATVDYYNIFIKGRLTSSQLFIPVVGTEYNYFVNGYNTRTNGVDVILAYSVPIETGALNLTATGNYNDNRVGSYLAGDITAAQIIAIQRKLPHITSIVSADYSLGDWQFTGRGRYYGSLVDEFFDLATEAQTIHPITMFDADVSYNFTEHAKLTVGAENLLNAYPQRVLWGGPLGNGNTQDYGRLYPTALPYTSDGGRYFARLTLNY